MALALVKSNRTGTIFNGVRDDEIKESLRILSISSNSTRVLSVVKFYSAARLKRAGYTDKDIIKILKKAHHDDDEIIDIIHAANTYNTALKDKGKI